MQTGKYRFRKGFGGVAVLQYQTRTPVFVGGQIDSSIVQYDWHDAQIDELEFSALYKNTEGDVVIEKK